VSKHWILDNNVLLYVFYWLSEYHVCKHSVVLWKEIWNSDIAHQSEGKDAKESFIVKSVFLIDGVLKSDVWDEELRAFVEIDHCSEIYIVKKSVFNKWVFDSFDI